MDKIDPVLIENIAKDIQRILDASLKPTNYETLSGRGVGSVSSSATLNGLTKTRLPGSGHIQAPVVGNSPRVTVRGLAEELSKIRIEQALQRAGSLDLPKYNFPPIPELPPKPAVTPGLLKVLGPLSTFLDLMTHSSELNVGEDERLKQYRQDDLKSSGGPR